MNPATTFKPILNNNLINSYAISKALKMILNIQIGKKNRTVKLRAIKFYSFSLTI